MSLSDEINGSAMTGKTCVRSVSDGAADHGKGTGMNRTAAIIGGAVLIVFGLVFTFQGLGYLGGSAMTGKTLWAVLGPIIALAGLALVVVGRRRGRVR